MSKAEQELKRIEELAEKVIEQCLDEDMLNISSTSLHKVAMKGVLLGLEAGRREVFDNLEILKECDSTISFHECKKHPEDCMFHIDLEDSRFILLKKVSLGLLGEKK